MTTAAPEAAEAFRSRFEFKKELGKGGIGGGVPRARRLFQARHRHQDRLLAMLEDPEVGARVKKMWPTCRPRTSDFVPLETRRKDLAGKVRFAVHRAIHCDPEIRYASWQAFCDGWRSRCRR